jgi:leucyl/phenylalanyl-tRNA--protein transferase
MASQPYPHGMRVRGADLGPSVEQAIALYAAGYFPMDDPAEEHNPLPFYAAERRAVLELDDAARAAVRRRLRRSLRAAREDWRLVRDQRFDEVLDGCARPREPGDGVWITPRMRTLYRRLHEAGLAHSFEIDAGGELAAGMIGVLIGRAAMLESMFHRVGHAGNVLLARTLDQLAADGFALCDIQLPTEHTTWIGARLVERAEYEARLRAALGLA